MWNTESQVKLHNFLPDCKGTLSDFVKDYELNLTDHTYSSIESYRTASRAHNSSSWNIQEWFLRMRRWGWAILGPQLQLWLLYISSWAAEVLIFMGDITFRLLLFYLIFSWIFLTIYTIYEHFNFKFIFFPSQWPILLRVMNFRRPDKPPISILSALRERKT